MSTLDLGPTSVCGAVTKVVDVVVVDEVGLRLVRALIVVLDLRAGAVVVLAFLVV